MLKKLKTGEIFKKYGFTLFLFLLVLFVSGGVAAKYMTENGGVGWFRAKEFYFTSNLLRTEKEMYVLNSDATEVTFTLGNNADKLRYAEDEIKYRVSVTSGDDDDMVKMISNENATEANPFDGILENNKVSTDFITVKNLLGKIFGEVFVFNHTAAEKSAVVWL